MKVSAASEALPFGDFLAVLRARGFTIGVEHHLRLARLLDRAGSSIAPSDLKRLLCPVFATDAAEQEAFYAAFDSYFSAILAESADASTDVAALEAQEFQAGSSLWRRWLWLALALLAALIGAILLHSQDASKSTAGTATPAPAPAMEKTPEVSPESKPATTPVPTPTIGHALTTLLGSEPNAATPTHPSLPTRTLATLREHPVALHGLALALPLLGFAFGEWRRWRRRELLIERARGRKPPFTWPVRVAAPKIREFHSQPLYAAARALRRRQAADTERLDLAATLQATIRAGGLPRLVYRRGSRVPEYLVLIDCASPRDHQAALFDQLAAALEREGVFVVRYFYRGDPRICWDERVSHPLTDLRRLHPEHRLLIFGDGAGLLDPVSGAPAAWLPLLCEWRERVLLTPTPSSRWGWREETIETQLAVVPATVEALAVMPDLLERGASGAGLAIWRDDTPPPPAGRTLSIEALHAYLGEGAFDWLCACAIYPELQVNLTLHLAAQMPDAAALLTEAVFLRLARLPWLRDGALPEDIRIQLLAALPTERQSALRQSMVALLEASRPPAGSHAADARQLDIAIQRHWLNRHERTALERTPPVAALPFGEQTRDYAELRLHEPGSGSRLALHLPSRLRALLYDQATPGLGFQPFVRGLIAVLIAWSGWALCERVTTVPAPKPVLITELTWEVAPIAPPPLPPEPLPQNPKPPTFDQGSPGILFLPPTPTPPLPQKPEPLPPSENVVLRASAATAQTLEDQENWPRALEAWIEVAQRFPESKIGKTHIGFIVDSLGRTGASNDLQESSALRKALEKAAKLKVQAAIMFLADNLRDTEPEASFAHYSAAAELGVASALTMKGVMLANGYGCEKNLAEAVKFLEKAAAAPDGFRAKAALADLYLQGSDVLKKDEVKAVELFRDAADGGDRRAMDQLATCYDKGIGVAVDHQKAFELYKRAAELGFHHSLGNLAVLYINGKVGSQPEPLKAVALLRQGNDAGDDFCLFLYARCLESGTGVKQNTSLARETYKKAAEAGNREAQKWCADHGVEFQRPRVSEIMRSLAAPKQKTILIAAKPETPALRAEPAEPLPAAVAPAKIDPDVTGAENKSVKAEMLARIDLIPNLSQLNKDKLYRSVERARSMGKIVTIPFASGGSAVPPSDAEILKTTLESPAVMKLRDDPTTVFVILGYADPKGDGAKNIAISQARADSVYALMKNKCNVVNIMHSVAMGGAKLLNADNLEKNRIVEVWAVRP